jgi:hypothetical protein
MPQLNLNFANLPDPLLRVWERLDSQQKQIIIETLARLLTKGTQSVKPKEPSHD